MATDTIARAMAGNAKRLLDEYKNNPDVADIVQNKAALDAYDTSKLSESDIVKVLDDESRNHMETYYKWVNNDWDYIGGLGPYYTQTEINNLLLERLAANQVATIQQSTVASKAYSVGDLLIYNGVLYQVTADIASGATITVGTNVAATTIEEVIKNGQKQADWNQNDSNEKDFIKNKPTIPAEQIQSNWTQTNSSAKDYIKNKPTIPSAVTANPTLSGNERNLNGLQVGNAKYKVDNAPKIHDDGYSNEWENITWVGMSAGALRTFQGGHTWTDGENIYWSNQTYHYVLTRGTKTWSTKSWYGLTNFTGSEVWTDGENIYCSQGSSQYVLNKNTSTWSAKTWNGLTNFYGSDIWVDGENIYHSRSSKQYVLNKNTSTWETKTWNNFNPPYGSYIWTDGENMYYSKEGSNYILNRETSTWSTKTWSGFSYINGHSIWTDGSNIYHSDQGNDYVLNKTNSTWSQKVWIGYTVYGGSVWRDGDNIYCSLMDTTQMQLQTGYHKPEYIEKVAETGSYNDLKDKPETYRHNLWISISGFGVLYLKIDNTRNASYTNLSTDIQELFNNVYKLYDLKCDGGMGSNKTGTVVEVEFDSNNVLNIGYLYIYNGVINKDNEEFSSSNIKQIIDRVIPL